MKLPRFSLRDLFWLVLVVGMGCAWWLDHASLTVPPKPTPQIRVPDGGVVTGMRLPLSRP
jgi:hypothetical protein